jgi:hypothetical protein
MFPASEILQERGQLLGRWAAALALACLLAGQALGYL